MSHIARFFVFLFDKESFLLDFCYSYSVFYDEWYLLINSVVFKLVNNLFFDTHNLVWNGYSCSVCSLVLKHVWFVDSDSEGNFVVNCVFEFTLKAELLFFVLSNGHLFGNYIRNFLHNCVINSYCGLVRNFDAILIRNFVVDGIGDHFGYHVRHRVIHGVGFLSASEVRHLDFNLVRDLPLNCVRDLLFHLIRLQDFHINCHLLVNSLRKLDRDLFHHSLRHLSSNLVLLLDVLCHSVDMCIV